MGVRVSSGALIRRAITWGMLICAPAVSASAQPPRFDGRGWIVGHQERNARESLTEYVLPGQTMDNWRELVTSTVFLQAVPMGPFVERVHASMAQGCPSLVWNVITQNEQSATYEFSDQGCGGFEATHEIDRVRIERGAMYRLAYAVKTKSALPPARRKEWLGIFEQTPLAEGLLSAAAAPAAPAARPAAGAGAGSGGAGSFKTLSAEELAAGVRKAGWPCPAGVKGEVKGQTPGPAGLLTIWALDCSNGQRFTVMVDPAGAITSFPTPP